MGSAMDVLSLLWVNIQGIFFLISGLFVCVLRYVNDTEELCSRLITIFSHLSQDYRKQTLVAIAKLYSTYTRRYFNCFICRKLQNPDPTLVEYANFKAKEIINLIKGHSSFWVTKGMIL